MIASHFATVRNVTVLWPSSGLALAAFLRFGSGLWPGAFGGALAAGLAVDDPLMTSTLIAAGSTLAPMLGAWLLRRFGFRLSLNRQHDYILILLWGALVSTLFGAGLGAFALVDTGGMGDRIFSAVVWHRWMADAMGVILAVPVIVLWSTPRAYWRDFIPARAGEALVLFGAAFIVGQVMFCGWWWWQALGPYIRAFYIFPVLVLGTLRFMRPGAAVMLLMSYAQTLYGSIHGVGYFSTLSSEQILLQPWLFHVALNLTGMVLALVLHERQQAVGEVLEERGRLRASERRERHRNRVLERLAHGAALCEVLDTLMRGIASQRPDLCGAILVLDESDHKLTVGAAPDLPAEFKQFMERAYVETTIAAAGRVVHHGAGIQVEDLLAQPFAVVYRDMLRRNGLVPYRCEPVLSATDGRMLGVFAWYRCEAKVFDPADRALSEDATQLAGIAIERQRAQEELQLAGLVYRSASEAIMVIDADHHIVAVNPAFTAITGYEAHEVHGRDPETLASEGNPDGLYADLWQSLRSRGSWQGEIRSRRKNGESFVEWLTINVLRDEHGAIYRYIALFTDITHRKQAEEQVWRQANYDGLTDLPNRRLFRDRLQQEIKKSQRDGTKLALLLIDLDFFKDVNDSLGHDVGDRLLMEAAKRIGACIRETDTLARLGGDEFTVVLPNLSGEALSERAAQAVVQSLAQPFQLGPESVYVTASVGIAHFPEHGSNAEDLVAHPGQVNVPGTVGPGNWSHRLAAAIEDWDGLPSVQAVLGALSARRAGRPAGGSGADRVSTTLVQPPPEPDQADRDPEHLDQHRRQVEGEGQRHQQQ